VTSVRPRTRISSSSTPRIAGHDEAIVAVQYSPMRYANRSCPALRSAANSSSMSGEGERGMGVREDDGSRACARIVVFSSPRRSRETRRMAAAAHLAYG
jgi:hypothetical protein